jgi:hypothetical protein
MTPFDEAVAQAFEMLGPEHTNGHRPALSLVPPLADAHPGGADRPAADQHEQAK